MARNRNVRKLDPVEIPEALEYSITQTLDWEGDDSIRYAVIDIPNNGIRYYTNCPIDTDGNIDEDSADLYDEYHISKYNKFKDFGLINTPGYVCSNGLIVVKRPTELERRSILSEIDRRKQQIQELEKRLTSL